MRQPWINVRSATGLCSCVTIDHWPITYFRAGVKTANLIN
jgi:hypothetical protein